MKFLHATLLCGISLIALSSLSACETALNDDLSGCRHTLWATMSNKDCTQQGAKASQFVAPKGKVQLLAFDHRGLLAADTSWTQTESRPVQRVAFHSLGEGTFTILGWAGVENQLWDQPTLKRGQTRLTDVLLQHKVQQLDKNQAGELGKSQVSLMDLDNSQLWVGQNSAFLKLPNPNKAGHVEQEVTLNMHEQTFHVTAEIEVDPTTFDGKNDVSAHDFDIRVIIEQPKLLMDGSLATSETKESKEKALIDVNYTRTSKLLTATFTVPALTARNSKVRLELINGTNGKIVEQGTFDLLGLLMLQQEFDPSCTRNAKLRFVLRDRCLDCGEFSCFSVLANGLKLGNFTDANQ